MNNQEDVYYVQESGKMVVQDLELRDQEKQDKKKNRKKVGYGVDSDTDSDDEGNHTMQKKGMSSGQLKKIIKQQQQNSTLMHRSQNSSGIQKSKSKYQ